MKIESHRRFAHLTLASVFIGANALRLTRAEGKVLMVGLASFPWGGDWIPIWLKELQVVESYVYGLEEWRGRRVRTMEIVLDWMTRNVVNLGW